MRDAMTPLSIEQLLGWLDAEGTKKTVFGIDRQLLFEPPRHDLFTMHRFGRLLETPIGVAAGPHTQLAANIACAWLTGSRFIELKTIQVLDRIEVAKPCIDMADEGYNCEWSQELGLDQSFEEYLKGWLLTRILQERFDLAGDEPGFLFNMSVGYDLDGVISPPVQRFLDRMDDATADAELLWAKARSAEPLVDTIAPPARLSDSVTMSTMHGCPPEEIERIALHLIRERGLHTAVKLNPSLLGADRVREILNGRLGWTIEVPDAAFDHDLKWDEALDVIRSLQSAAASAHVELSVKLTNTLEVVNPGVPLPEQTLYLSGRALHPLAVSLAADLSTAFDGKLDLSFAGGADDQNVADLVAAGLAPVTVCSDLLKPGGYPRQLQYLEAIEAAAERKGAGSLDELIRLTSGSGEQPTHVAALSNLRALAARVVDDPRYRAAAVASGSFKGSRKLTAFDCVQAPCVEACATDQAIPEYISRIASGDPDGAFEVILATNPLPAVTGQVCDHTCQLRCTRIHLDQPLLIRELKRFAEEHHTRAPEIRPLPPTGRSAAIVGAGPSGLSCAWFLRLEGWQVDLFEKAAGAGGMVSATIPSFRLLPDALERDIRRIQELGVRCHFGHEINAGELARLRARHDAVYLALGAGSPRELGIPGERSIGVHTALAFLSATRKGQTPAVGNRIAVIGGGNAAMDAARTALRLAPPGASVTVLYRRGRADMPADRHEVQEALAEGVLLVEHVSPVEVRPHQNGLDLTLIRMTPGEAEQGGRPCPIPVEGSEFIERFDTLITAVGQRPILHRVGLEDLTGDPETGRTGTPGLYLGGDALRGPATVIAAVGDGRSAAAAILEDTGERPGWSAPNTGRSPDRAAHARAAARRMPGAALPELPLARRHGFQPVVRTLGAEEARHEAGRCLDCDLVCDLCITVCPNRALLAVDTRPARLHLDSIRVVDGRVSSGWSREWRLAQEPQILVAADLCNACGNCAAFCPTAGSPYLDKPRIWLSVPGWMADDRAYHFAAAPKGLTLTWHHQARRESLALPLEGPAVYDIPEARIELDAETLSVLGVEPSIHAEWSTELERAAAMWTILRMLRGGPLAAAALREND